MPEMLDKKIKQKPPFGGRCLHPLAKMRKVVHATEQDKFISYFPPPVYIRRSFSGFGAITRTFLHNQSG